MEAREKLIEEYVYWYNEFLEDELEYPDEAKLNWSSFLLCEKLLLQLFNLPTRKSYKTELRNIILDEIKDESINGLWLPRLDYTNELSDKIIKMLSALRRTRSCKQEV